MLRKTLLIGTNVYTFKRHSPPLRGFDVYRDGVWIAWTAGNLTDARNIAKDMAKQKALGED